MHTYMNYISLLTNLRKLNISGFSIFIFLFIFILFYFLNLHESIWVSRKRFGSIFQLPIYIYIILIVLFLLFSLLCFVLSRKKNPRLGWADWRIIHHVTLIYHQIIRYEARYIICVSSLCFLLFFVFCFVLIMCLWVGNFIPTHLNLIKAPDNWILGYVLKRFCLSLRMTF